MKPKKENIVSLTFNDLEKVYLTALKNQSHMIFLKQIDDENTHTEERFFTLFDGETPIKHLL